MGELHVGIDVVLGGLVMGLLWFLKQDRSRVNRDIENCSKKIDKHVEECDKIPKSLLVEKIDTVCERLDDTRSDLRAFRDETRADFREFKTGLFKALGKQ